MGWKRKTCIAAAMFLLYGADASLMTQEAAAAAVQEDGQDFVQTGLTEVEALLKQGNYAEAEAKCRRLQEYGAGKNTLDFQVLHTLGAIYRIEGKHAEEIALWKGVYEKFASIFQVNNTQELLRPLGELCSAYQAAGDFASAEPYVRRGEEILREHAGDNLEESLKDISFFRTVSLFQRIGTGKIMPADASKEAAELLKDDSREIKPGIRESGWLTYYPWCELELLDVVRAAVASSQTFSEDVADFRRSDDTVMLLQGAEREEMMWCMGRAAQTYMVLLGRSKDAERMLAPLYQEIKQEYRHPGTQQEAEAMLFVLQAKGIQSVLSGNHTEAIETVDIAWDLYENTSKSQDVQDTLFSLLFGTIDSYQAMGETEKLKSSFGRAAQISKSESVVVCYGKMINVFLNENSDEAEKRQVLLDLRAAADKECAEQPNREPIIRKMMQMLTDIMPERWASVIRSGQGDSVRQDTQVFGERSYFSRFELYTEAENAFAKKEYLKAIPLYERLLKLTLESGDVYGSMSMKALRRLARSNYLVGCQANEAGDKTKGKKFLDRGYEFYDTLIDMHELHRTELFSGLSPEERRKWFATVVDDYMEAVVFLPQEKAFDTLEKCKARILLEQYAEQFADASGVLNEEEAAQLRIYRQETQKCREALRRIEELQENQATEENVEFQNARRNWKRALENEQQYREFLGRKHSAYRELSKPRILTAEEGKKLLPTNTAFFEYVMRRSENYARATDMLDDFSLMESGVRTFGSGNAYWDEWFSYYKLLSYPDSEKGFESFSEVYRLWKIEKQGYIDEHYLVREKQEGQPANAKERIDSLQGFENARKELAEKWGEKFAIHFSNVGIRPGMKVIIAPDDRVPAMPFETLTYKGKSFTDLYEISYTPSLSVYALTKERGETNSSRKDRKDLFAMGNAVYSGIEGTGGARDDRFALLPGTAKELEGVAQLFPEEERKTVLQQKDASEQKLKDWNKSGKLAQYKYLLFATHGVFDEDNPMANAIVLSSPDKTQPAARDGYVTVGEWMGYKLNSDLVYLSACETGRGTSYAGEGLIGLPYALTIAGNKSTVMTLWKIEDEPSAEFSKSFFSRLVQGQTAALALAETKREFLNHKNPAYRDPHVWGAFQLYGE